MRLREGGGVDRTAEDRWVIIADRTGPDRTRLTIVGRFLHIGDATKFKQRVCEFSSPALDLKPRDLTIARLMLPTQFEGAVYNGNLVQYGFAAHVPGRAVSVASARDGDEIRALCALKDREAITVNLVRFGGLGKRRARAVARAILGESDNAQDADE